jgi:transcriptional regulator with XRE-family HTH domain
MGFGDNLKQIRRERGMTQQALAEAVGTKKQTIARYENGMIQTPPYDRVEALAMALCTTPAFLLGWEEEIPYFGEAAADAAPGMPEECRRDAGEQVVYAEDDAMIGDRIHAHDKVYLKPGPVEDGQIAAVKREGKLLLRRVYRYPEQHALLLVASNPLYEPILLFGADRACAEVQGCVCRVEMQL